MKELDPDFRLERWTGELREYIVPEVVDAYLSADRESLRQWCGEAVSTFKYAYELVLTVRPSMSYGLLWVSMSSRV